MLKSINRFSKVSSTLTKFVIRDKRKGSVRLYCDSIKENDFEKFVAKKSQILEDDLNQSPLKLLDNAADFRDLSPETVDDIWYTPTYPKGAPDPRRDQSKHSQITNKIDPNFCNIILFPGQGVQYVGMNKKLLDYPNVKDMFDLAESILGYKLLDLCLNGPKEKLDKTEFCQPAVVISSLAAVEKLRDDMPHVMESCVATAGFSVGEITALIFSGAISFENGLKLVKLRAEAMQACSEMIPSGMMTVFYKPDSKVKFACHAAKLWCEKQGIINPDCRIANFLFPGCCVIGGNSEALDFIINNNKEFKIKAVKRLPVSGAFHTSLMKAAVEPMKEMMKQIEVQDPLISIHSCVNGHRYQNKKHIIDQLPRQICLPVKWEQTMHILYERKKGSEFPRTFECGPGSSLSSILSKVNAKANESCSTFHI